VQSFSAPGQSVLESMLPANSAAVGTAQAPATLGFNLGTFTVPQPPVTSEQQQLQGTPGATGSSQLPSSSTEKKTKTGKKSKVSSLPVQSTVSVPVTDANGMYGDFFFYLFMSICILGCLCSTQITTNH